MLAASVVVAVLVLLSLLQLALACGAPWGAFAWGGRQRVLPPALRVASVCTIAVYALLAVIVLDSSGAIDVLPDGVTTVGTWVLFGFAALSVVVNAFSRSTPERLTMAPLSLVLAVASFAVATG